MAKKELTKETILKGYQDYLLDEGKVPETVRVFTKHMKISDEDFYLHFGSLKNIEATIWNGYFNRAFEVVEKDPEFEEMTPREKHLSYLFTILEIMKPDRSYILFRLEGKNPATVPSFVSETSKIITQSDIEWAKASNFIPEKAKNFTQTAYKRVLWQHVMATVFFWLKDDTGGAQETDVFIEKSTRTVFDIGELPALDSFLDLGKFFLQKMGLAKTEA